ncbi:zinc ribbon domain-containing protein [Solihabitans fulvus]|uniref:Zinc ribbon domain-containing protein n=1 Tax=Solihabitans fulvus TaxID=1892852 RepID=A0A5B2XEX7_9PSEU|nr:zinc ribbon domain-containing protein [Solihabitans fulvus]
MLIWGWRTYMAQLAMLNLVCSGCHNPSAHSLRRRTTKFTLFFIPLFPISRKHSLQCTFCGLSYEISREQADQLVAQAQSPAMQEPQPQQPWAGQQQPQQQWGQQQPQQPWAGQQQQQQQPWGQQQR